MTLPNVRTTPVYILSEDPNGLKGINQTKYSKAIQSRYKVIKPYRDQLNDKDQWCIAAVPGVAWAKKVFPELSRARAVERLWEVILQTSRVSEEGDPNEAWEKAKGHYGQFEGAAKYIDPRKE